MIVVIVAVAVASIVGAVGGSKPKAGVAGSAQPALPTTALLRANWKLPGVCGGSSKEACVPASDLSMRDGVATVDTGWAATPLVTANAAGGGKVSPGQASLVQQVCALAEDAARSPATETSPSPGYVPVAVDGRDALMLARSNRDGSCST